MLCVCGLVYENDRETQDHGGHYTANTQRHIYVNGSVRIQIFLSRSVCEYTHDVVFEVGCYCSDVAV